MARILDGNFLFLSSAVIFSFNPQVAHGHAAFDAIAAPFILFILIPPTIINIAITIYILEKYHVTFVWQTVLCTSVLFLSLAGMIGGWVLMLVIFLVLKFGNIIGKTHVGKI